MDKIIRKNYEHAGRIHQSAVKRAKKIVKADVLLLNIATELESFIQSELKEHNLKGGLAFPVNLSVNFQAAHATPKINDETLLHESDLLKIDMGVQVDGFIADGAFSINFSNDHAKQIETNEAVLETALSVIKVGHSVSEIGNAVEPLVEKAGFKVISNLTGHGLGQFTQHAPPSIPNTRNHSSVKIGDPMAFAVEPFVSTGRGSVADSAQVEIFSVEELRPVRDLSARKILEFAHEVFSGLPFAERQLSKIGLSDFARKVGLRELVKAGILHSYPVLVEQKDAFVSQCEKTVIIDDQEVIVIN